MQYVHGKSAFNGFDEEYNEESYSVFKMSKSKEDKNGTYTIEGQFAEIIYCINK